MVRIRCALSVAVLAAFFGAGCATVTGTAPWPVVAAVAYAGVAMVTSNIHTRDSTEATLDEVICAADSCARAVVGAELFNKATVRVGGWNEQTQTYRYSYEFALDAAGELRAIIPVEVSLAGGARINVARRNGWYFDYEEDYSVYHFRISPRVAANIAIDSGLGELAGPLRVQLNSDWLRDLVVWRVDRYVADDGAGYFDTIDIDPQSGTVLNRFRNAIGTTYSAHDG